MNKGDDYLTKDITTKVCYALDLKHGNFRCKAISAKRCNSDSCAFYRTDIEADEADEKTNARLRSLPEDEQLYIADKYYGGKTTWRLPWKMEGGRIVGV